MIGNNCPPRHLYFSNDPKKEMSIRRSICASLTLNAEPQGNLRLCLFFSPPHLLLYGCAGGVCFVSSRRGGTSYTLHFTLISVIPTEGARETSDRAEGSCIGRKSREEHGKKSSFPDTHRARFLHSAGLQPFSVEMTK